MTLYQAAVLAEPKNFLAANELGVLLAENGNLARARELLAHSARLYPAAVTLQNLAAVHVRLGEREQADQALAKAMELEPGRQNRRAVAGEVGRPRHVRPHGAGVG